MENIYILLGNISASLLVCFLVIKYLAKKIIENQFERSLENYRHKISLDFDRIQKINQKEFEVLPEIWNLINNFRLTCFFYLTKRILTEDINKFLEVDLELFLKSIPITESQKLYIRNSNNKNNAYLQIVQHTGTESLHREYEKLKVYYRFNKIFLTNKISSLVSELDKFYFETTIIYPTLINDQTAREAFSSDFEKTSRKYIDQIYPEIKTRLKFSEN
ncbi:hypothetical protein [Leptospira meyeri]|uniref:hypothetical protein n=1 Tax=Leptospira meyeri TaxID=29508 RepID=UPI0002BFC443|nr:hypothetical protein [Leptospira meyeri]EMJ85366.1 hypothetical protein LEP1GSC196_4003 [Leptospira meyeri serovar Semaranga str. Veldrot Semarang 173]